MTTLRRVVNWYSVMLRIETAVQLQYRASAIIWVLTSISVPLINLAVWTAVAGARPVAGMSAAYFAGYYLAMMIVEHITYQWVGVHMDHSIRGGQMSSLLLSPVHPIHRQVGEHLAHKLLGLTLLLPLWLIVGTVLGPMPYSPQPLHMAGFVLALVLAGVLNFLLGYAVSLLGFWTTRTLGLYNLFAHGITYLLAGKLVPLDMLPATWNRLNAYLPFPYIAAFPIRVLMGQVAPSELPAGFAMQIGWIFAVWLVSVGLWHSGVRRYTAVGG